ncbi:hypothetical protein Tco_1503969 [Tanacetum coccineum]
MNTIERLIEDLELAYECSQYVFDLNTSWWKFSKVIQVRATIEDITELGTSVAFEHRFDKMMLLTWHDSSTSVKKSVCDSLTPRYLPQDDSSTHVKDSVCDSVTPKCNLIVC